MDLELNLREFAGHPGNWVFRRMTAQPKSIRWLEDPETVTPADYRVSVVGAGAPATWAFARPPRAERDPRHPNFKRYDDRSVVIDSDEGVTRWLDSAARATEMVEKSGLPPEILSTEIPHWRKLTVQRGEVVSWFTGAVGPGEVHLEIPTRFREILDHVAKVYAAHRAPVPFHPDPADTNGGYPTFMTHPAAKLVGVLLGGDTPDLDRIVSLGQAFSHAVGLNIGAMYGYGISKRSGPVYKELDQLRFQIGPNWQNVAVARGTQQRNRKVQMAWAGANRLLRPLYTALSGSRRAIHGLWHTGGPDHEPLLRHVHHYESDISGYDSSVNAEIQDAVGEAWSRAFPELSATIRFWRYMETRPLLTPSWELSDGGCGIVQSVGGIKSGLKLTSEFGTFLNIAATLYAIESAGGPRAEWWPSEDAPITLFVLGDDARISSAVELDPTAWTNAFAELGLKCEIFPGVGFLSRIIHPDVINTPIAGRIVQQTMSHEHERKGAEALGLAYLGFIARTEGVDRLPEVLQRAAWDVIQEAEWVRKLPAQRSITGLRNYLLESASVQETIADALRTTAGTSWYNENLRASEHSVPSAIAVSIADHAVARLGAVSHAQAQVVEAIATRVVGMGAQFRLREAIAGYFALASGSKPGYEWMHSLTTSRELKMVGGNDG